MIKVSAQRSIMRRMSLTKVADAGSDPYGLQQPLIAGAGRGLPQGPIAPSLHPRQLFSRTDPYGLQQPLIAGARRGIPRWLQGGVSGMRPQGLRGGAGGKLLQGLRSGVRGMLSQGLLGGVHGMFA